MLSTKDILEDVGVIIIIAFFVLLFWFDVFFTVGLTNSDYIIPVIATVIGISIAVMYIWNAFPFYLTKRPHKPENSAISHSHESTKLPEIKTSRAKSVEPQSKADNDPLGIR
jgi:hypothetical protein